MSRNTRLFVATGKGDRRRVARTKDGTVRSQSPTGAPREGGRRAIGQSGADAALWRVFALSAVLVMAGLWAYGTSFSGSVVFDDYPALVHNPNIRTLWPLATAMSARPDSPLAARPVASLTFAINYATAPRDARDVFESRPGGGGADAALAARNLWGYHALNVAIHLSAALVMFGVLRRTLLSERLRRHLGSAATTLSFVGALLWVVHPIHTEAVTYLVQRVESLMGLFVLLSLYCAIRATDARRVLAWSLGAVASAALAVGTKEVGACIPVLVVAWDWVFLCPVGTRPERSPTIRRRWILYVALAAASLLLLVTEPGARSSSVGLRLEGWTPWTYFLTESGVVVHYLRLALWPSPLVLDPYWPMVRSARQVAVPLAVLGLLGAATVVALVRRHPLGFVGTWFFVILAPTSSVLPIVTEVAAERRMYLPAAAVIATVLTAVVLILGHGNDRRGRRRTLQAAVAVLLCGSVLALGLQTRARSLDYRSDENIWRDTLRKQPENPRARMALGASLVSQGRFAEAEVELQEALRVDPRKAETLSNLGAAELALGKVDASISHLERAIALRPEFTDAHRNLAEAYAARGNDALAVAHFRRVLDVDPDNAVVLHHMAFILAVSADDSVRNGAAALDAAERAARLTFRRNPAILGTLASALAELDRFDEAAGILREALPLASGNPPLAVDLSRMLSAYSAGRTLRNSSR